MCGATARQQLNVPVRLTPSTSSHASGGYSQVAAFGPEIPALLIKMSMRPNAASVASRAFSTSSSLVTSAANAATRPCDFSAAAVFSARVKSRSQMATAAPEARKRSTIARPMPWAPPGTTGGEALPSFGEFFRVWLKIGCINFGGPAGQIAMMHRMMVDEKRWIDEPRFLHALNFCMLLPGPEAQKLATYIGWLLHGIRGGLVAGILFVLPGAFVMLGLSLLYALGRGFSVVDGALFGIKAAVLVIVLEALIRIGKRALKTSTLLGLAAAGYIGIFFLAMPFPLIVLAAGVIGFLVAQSSPQLLGLKADVGQLVKPAPGRWRQAVTVTVIGLVAWWAPVALAAVTLGPNHVLVSIGTFFSKLAVVSFGGAYALLAYMAQEAVETHGWMTAPEMVDGLGLAETTPGPLILVTQFVGFLAGFRGPEPFPP